MNLPALRPRLWLLIPLGVVAALGFAGLIVTLVGGGGKPSLTGASATMTSPVPTTSMGTVNPTLTPPAAKPMPAKSMPMARATHATTPAKQPVRTTAAARPTVHRSRPASAPITSAARLTVTPGAFCKNAQAGQVGYSRAGKAYRCTYYPSSARYRWKLI